MLSQIIARIDAEIAKRGSDDIGVKFSQDLFNKLQAAGKIRTAVFTAAGTGAFPAEVNAYDGKYYASVDHTWDGDHFEVGVPDP